MQKIDDIKFPNKTLSSVYRHKILGIIYFIIKRKEHFKDRNCLSEAEDSS